MVCALVLMAIVAGGTPVNRGQSRLPIHPLMAMAW